MRLLLFFGVVVVEVGHRMTGIWMAPDSVFRSMCRGLSSKCQQVVAASNGQYLEGCVRTDECVCVQ